MGNSSSHTAIDVADYLLGKSSADAIPITNLKLQRLVYLAYGLYYAYAEQPLFIDRIQCTDSGPNISSLYNLLKNYGNSVVTRQSLMELHKRNILRSLDLANIPNDLDYFSGLRGGNPSFSNTEKGIMNATWDNLKNHNDIQIANWTTANESAWDKAHHKGLKYIPDEMIFEEFKNFVNREEGQEQQVKQPVS